MLQYSDPRHPPFSPASDLDNLATLHRLDTFGLKAVNHQIGEEGLQKDGEAVEGA